MKKSLDDKFEKRWKTSTNSRNIASNPLRLASILAVGLGLIIGLNLAIVLHKILVEDKLVERTNRMALARAQSVADTASKYIRSIKEQAVFYAKKPTLNASLAIRDQAALESAKKSIMEEIPGLVAMQFIYRGEAQLDPKASPPIRFTELEMIRRAEARENVAPEAAKIDGKWGFNLIIPMPYGDKQDVLASMLLSFTVDNIKQEMLQGKSSLGRLVLEQKYGNSDPFTIFSVGNGRAGEAVIKSIPNSYWQVEFTPSSALIASSKSSLIQNYIIIAIAALACVFVCFMGGRVLGKVIQARLGATDSVVGSSDIAPGKEKALTVNPQNVDILDVDIEQADEGLLGLDDSSADAPVNEKVVEEEPEDILDIEDDGDVPDVIFRAYDIRGIAKEQLTKELAQKIGQACGSEAIDVGQDSLIVARDARLSSPELKEYLVRGILASGCNVIDIGTVPTPLMYYATATLKESQSGIMVTASHNPGEYNGFKVVMNGKSRCDADIKAIRKRILRNDLYEGEAKETRHDIVPDYIDTIFSDVALAGDVSIVIDAANGVTGQVAPKLFEELGCHVIPLFCDLDGKFPNHAPDPSVASNLDSLIEKVKESKADLGVAFDGDGDRVVVVTSSGKIIWPDQLLMLFAKDIVSRNPGADVVFDVKSTKHLASCVTGYGGRPIMWKTGHAPMKNKMIETGALLGGEYSGHIFIKDRWFGFDDGMYAAARLIEILSLQGEPLDIMFEEFPSSPTTPEIRVPISEDEKFSFVDKLKQVGEFGDGRVTVIDGIRVDFSFGWGLVRASNTSPNLTLRFEGDDEESLHKVKSIIAKEMKKVDNSLNINWNT